jgi:outer membrane protein
LKQQHRNLEGVLFHMKRSLAIALTLASGLSLSAFAQSPAAPAAAAAAQPSKVAVIAFQSVVAQTNEFQRNYADLQKKFDPRREQLKTQSDAVDTMTKQLQSQAATLSDAERTSRAAEIDNKKKQLQRDLQDAQSDFQQEMQEMFGGVAQKVGQVMQAYASKQGYTLVLDASQQDSPILFATDTTNITKPVLEAYNQKSGIPAPPVSAPEPHTGATTHSGPASHPAAHASTASH